MGRAKDEMMRHEELVGTAVHQCINIGAIQECPVHAGTYLDSLEYADPSELAQAILKDDPSTAGEYQNHAEMVSCLQDALDSAGEECSSCAKYMDE